MVCSHGQDARGSENYGTYYFTTNYRKGYSEVPARGDNLNP